MTFSIKSLCIIVFLSFSMFTIGQDLSKKTKEELIEMKSEAVDAEDFGLANRIKIEIDSRKSITEFQEEYELELESALKNENYNKAALIKDRIQLCEDLINADSLMKVAIENEDYKKAQKLKEEKEEGLKVLGSPLGKEKNDIPNEEYQEKDNEPVKNKKQNKDSIIELFIEPTYMGDLFINDEYVATTSTKEGVRAIIVPGTHRVRYGGSEIEFTFKEGNDYILQAKAIMIPRYKMFSKELTIKDFRFEIVNLNKADLNESTEYFEADMKDEFEYVPNYRYPFTYSTFSMNPVLAGVGRAAAFRVSTEGSFSPKLGLYGGLFYGTVGHFYHDYYTFYIGPTFLFRSNRKHFNMALGLELPYTFAIDGDFGPYSRGIQLDLGDAGFEIGANFKLAFEYYFGGNVGISLTGLIGTNGIPEGQMGVVIREVSIKRKEYRNYLFD